MDAKKVKRGWLSVGAIAGIGMLAAAPVHSTPIGSPDDLNPSSTIIDFESLETGTPEPITTDGMTLWTTKGTLHVQDQSLPQHPGLFEGKWFGEDWNGPIPLFVIEFDKPVSEFGFGIVDPNYAGDQLIAKDASGQILETITSPSPEFILGPTGASHATFVGFVRDTPDIKRVELHMVGNDWVGLDNITYFRDEDGDGVPDAKDSCDSTEIGAKVNEDGCAVSQLCPCSNQWNNHGAYTSCVAQTAESFLDAGLISEEEKGAICSAAGRSACGSKK